MNIAFYCPMKHPYHPNPSGDRQIARLILKALKSQQHSVEIVSTLRSWHATADHTFYQRKQDQAQQIAKEYLKKAKNKPDLWVTYHLYHKAPDWLGPLISQELDIPYYIIEASYSQKLIGTEWEQNLETTKSQIQKADKVFTFHAKDKAGLLNIVDESKIIDLPLFIDTDYYTIPHIKKSSLRKELCSLHQGLDTSKTWLCAVGMMRSGDKLNSYQQLANIIKAVSAKNTQLLIIGDGKERIQIESFFPKESVFFLDQKSKSQLKDIYNASDIFIWPAINEALGLSLLEAQASALPVICGRTSGTASIISDQETGFLYDNQNHMNAVSLLDTLIQDHSLRDRMSHNAKNYAQQKHSFSEFLKYF